MEKIEHCEFGKKKGFKYGSKGKCYTYNNNVKSRRKAYEFAYNDLSLAYQKRFDEIENKEIK